MTKVYAELDGEHRVRVSFRFDPFLVEQIRDVPSQRFVPESRGGPHWHVHLDLTVMRELRAKFGRRLRLGPKLKERGYELVALEKRLQAMAGAGDAELQRVPNNLRWSGDKKLRPFQRADIAFMAAANAVNANQPGSGKTSEVVLALAEAELLHGRQLVVAPLAALRLVWEKEIRDLYSALGEDEPLILTGDTPAERRQAISSAAGSDGSAYWLIINPVFIRQKKVWTLDGEPVTLSRLSGLDQMRARQQQVLECPELADIDWTSITIDEFHLMGLSNPQTQGSKGIRRIVKDTKPVRRYGLSGTPTGGKPIKLWGALNFIEPERFSSRWTWAGQWLEIERNNFGQQIGGVRRGREEEFQRAHSPYLIRRTKREFLPGLPPKVEIDVWCDMTKRQHEQYKTFAVEAEWRISDADDAGRLTATSILAEYTRLKQFADAYCEVEELDKINENTGLPMLKVRQTPDSGKLEQLMEKLAEEGVLDPDVQAPALIFSQFVSMVEMVAVELDRKGISTAVITGQVPKAERDRATRAFQDEGSIQVLVMNTMAGTALNLSRADSVHLLDETWTPDDQEQAADRAHRADSVTAAKDEIRIYTYRTQGTIEERIKAVVGRKRLNNRLLLDLRPGGKSRGRDKR